MGAEARGNRGDVLALNPGDVVSKTQPWILPGSSGPPSGGPRLGTSGYPDTGGFTGPQAMERRQFGRNNKMIRNECF